MPTRGPAIFEPSIWAKYPVGSYSWVLGDLASKGFIQASQQTRIVPLGDSLTVGDFGGYRKPLFDKLKESKIPFETQGLQADAWGRHEGHSGWQINSLSDKLTDSYFATINPREDLWGLTFLVLAGTNDAAGRAIGTQIVTRLKDLVNKLLAHGANVILMTLPPYPDRQAIVSGANEGIRQTFSHVKNVRIADIAKKLTPNDLAKDGVHLETRGYQKIANVLGQALGVVPIEDPNGQMMLGENGEPIYIDELSASAGQTPSSGGWVLPIALAAGAVGLWTWKRG